jgi:hypothetical protein
MVLFGIHSESSPKMVTKFKNQLKQLGPIALGTYAGISIISCATWSALFAFGVDIANAPVTNIIKKVEIPFVNAEWSVYLGLIWTAHTAIFPLRFGLTLATTPMIKRILINKNLINKL